MTVAGRQVPREVVLWFGLLAAPGAWVVEFLVGFFFDLAQCNRTGSRAGIAVDAWTVGVTVGAAVVAILGGVAALGVFRETRGMGEGPPPASRVHFLSVVGLTVTPLFLVLILMSGLGAAALEACHQS